MFFEKFISLCAKHNVKPNQVTKALGLSTATATDWRNGSIPRAVTMKKLADYFDVPMSYFTEKEKPSDQGELSDNQISPNEPKLTEGEELMLQLFRQIPEDKQQTVLETIRLVLKIQE